MKGEADAGALIQLLSGFYCVFRLHGFLPCWWLLLDRMGCAQSNGTSIGRESSNTQTLSQKALPAIQKALPAIPLFFWPPFRRPGE
jgi:hypothetical protein